MNIAAFFDSDFTRILAKLFLIPAFILFVFYILIFNERYKTQINALKHMQEHHMSVARDMGIYELENIATDAQNIYLNGQIQAFIHNPTLSHKQTARAELQRFTSLKRQYLAISICEPSGKTLLQSRQQKYQDNTDFCQKNLLHSADLGLVNMKADSVKGYDNVVIISTKNSSNLVSAYIEIVYNADHLINLIGNTSGHNDQYYIMPDKVTIWTTAQVSEHIHHSNNQTKLDEHDNELTRIQNELRGQFINNNGIFTYDVLSLGHDIIGNKTSWKIVCHNEGTKDIFRQELIYFSALTAISLFILFFISLIYYSLSKASRRIHMEMYEDHETGLYNKKFLENQLPLLIEQSRHFDNKLICIYIDLDNFVNVSEEYGKEISNEILKNVAKTIQKCVRKSDIVSRIGADQFVILMPFIEKLYIGSRTAAKIIEELNTKIYFKGKHINISASIGISNYPQHGDQLGTILTAADLAMYDVKNDSKNGYKMADAFEL